MDRIIFVGSYSNSAEAVRDLYRAGYRPAISLVRYADDDMASPSCCDWLIPGTISLDD